MASGLRIGSHRMRWPLSWTDAQANPPGPPPGRGEGPRRQGKIPGESPLMPTEDAG
jgi:hypothetical protein